MLWLGGDTRWALATVGRQERGPSRQDREDARHQGLGSGRARVQAAAVARGPRELQLFDGGWLAATLTVPLAGLAAGHGDLHGLVLCPFRSATGLACAF